MLQHVSWLSLPITELPRPLYKLGFPFLAHFTA